MTMAFLLAMASVCVANVHDGDSILLCDGEKIRIANIDAPEMPGSPKCERGRKGWCDYQLAMQARDTLEEFLSAGAVSIQRQGKDGYGRTLARLTVNGKDAGQYLVNNGLARRWR